MRACLRLVLAERRLRQRQAAAHDLERRDKHYVLAGVATNG